MSDVENISTVNRFNETARLRETAKSNVAAVHPDQSGNLNTKDGMPQQGEEEQNHPGAPQQSKDTAAATPPVAVNGHIDVTV